jgi:hypothetical protein
VTEHEHNMREHDSRNDHMRWFVPALEGVLLSIAAWTAVYLIARWLI